MSQPVRTCWVMSCPTCAERLLVAVSKLPMVFMWSPLMPGTRSAQALQRGVVLALSGRHPWQTHEEFAEHFCSETCTHQILNLCLPTSSYRVVLLLG